MNAILTTLCATLLYTENKLAGFIIEVCLIFSTVFTYSLYKKFKNQSIQNVKYIQQAYGVRGYLQVLTNPHQQPQVHQQPQIYHQPQVFEMHQFNQQFLPYQLAQPYSPPQAYQQCQDYQPSRFQHNFKFEEANQLPSYESVVPSAPQI